MHQGDSGRDSLRQLTALNRIARIALEDLDLGPMLQRIVDTLHDEFGWEFIAFARIDRERGEFRCEAVHSVIDTSIAVGYRRALGSGVVGECAMTGRTLDIEDTRTHPNFVDTLPGTRAELCVPIRHGEEVLAVLNVESRQPGAFRGQRALLETVADQIAGAIRAAQLLAALEQANAELREAYAIVEALSEHDGLTGIANRRSFDAWFAQACQDAQAAGAPLSLVLLDVDEFKAYNDGYGHLAGDECLRLVAAILKETLAGTKAWLARYGGEEFAVILPGVGPEHAHAQAERLREAVQACALEHRHALAGKVTISAGVATWAAGGDACATPGLLFAAADRALYDAKRAGRNRVARAA
jgi:diguanylate cyclase (GGDEF)-like protein